MEISNQKAPSIPPPTWWETDIFAAGDTYSPHSSWVQLGEVPGNPCCCITQEEEINPCCFLSNQALATWTILELCQSKVLRSRPTCPSIHGPKGPREPSLSSMALRGPEKLADSLNHLPTAKGIIKRPVSGTAKGNQPSPLSLTGTPSEHTVEVGSLHCPQTKTNIHPYCWGTVSCCPGTLQWPGPMWSPDISGTPSLLPCTQCQTHLGLPEQPPHPWVH